MRLLGHTGEHSPRLRSQREGLCQQLVGANAGLVRVGDADHDDLLGAVARGHLLELGPHLLRRAEDRPTLGSRPRSRAIVGLEELERPPGRGPPRGPVPGPAPGRWWAWRTRSAGPAGAPRSAGRDAAA